MLQETNQPAVSRKIGFPPIELEIDPLPHVSDVLHPFLTPLSYLPLHMPESGVEYPFLLPLKIQNDFCLTAKSRYFEVGSQVSREDICSSLQNFSTSLNVNKDSATLPFPPSMASLDLSLDLV